MRFCFIVEEQYRNDAMPMVIAEQLLQWGHQVDLIEPQTAVTCLTDMAEQGYDAYVLKSLAEGPGISLLEAAEAVGIPTINNSRSIRLVRDKAVAAAFAHAHGLPMPDTYFVAHPRLLQQLPLSAYPLVVKPSNGSSCRDVYRLNSQADLAALQISETNDSFFLAQRYEENTGFDMKVYVTGKEVYAAVAKKSPLHPTIIERFVPLTPQIRKLALQVGTLFGLDIYGVDIVETPSGLAILDINDFPSFAKVPRAVPRIAEYVLHAAKRAEIQRDKRNQQAAHRRQARQAHQQAGEQAADEAPTLPLQYNRGETRLRRSYMQDGAAVSSAAPRESEGRNGDSNSKINNGGDGKISKINNGGGSNSKISNGGDDSNSKISSGKMMASIISTEG